MNIILVASEVVPYAKTGGLADVAGALPKSLARLGHQVRVVMPRYRSEKIDAASRMLPNELSIPFDSTVQSTKIHVDDSGEVPVYFVDAPQYFSRGKLYGEPDDAERFAFFSRAVLEFSKSLGEPIDVIHLNDWMTGLVAAYLKTTYAGDPALASSRTLFTVHNLAFHGLFDPRLLSSFGLPSWLFRTEDGIEFYGMASALKAGLIFSDAISTVSPRYSREIQTPEYGEGFEGLLRSRSDDLFGILNGVDYDEWNPEHDSYVAARYSAGDLSGKRECKRDLLSRFGLPEDLDAPVIGCISRLSDQKGFDIILEVIEDILDRGVKLVVLGSGEEAYERAFASLREKWPSQVGVYLGFSNQVAHFIEAGADMFLMPSRFEPCGLNQMYSLKYGTVPIVRAAGGLDDTIQNFDRTTRAGNGFKFYEYTGQRLLEKVYEALLLYDDRDLWHNLVLNGMSADYSWEASARLYAELYNRLTERGSAANV